MQRELRAFTVLFHADRRQIGWCGHFRSRDKDGGHTIRSAISGNSHVMRKFTTLSFVDPELLPIEVLHCWNRKFAFFNEKWCTLLKFFIFAPPKRRSCHWNTFSDQLPTVPACILPELHAFKVLFYAESVGAWSLPVTWQKWRSHHSIRNRGKPHAIRKLHDSIFYRTGVIADWSFTWRE